MTDGSFQALADAAAWIEARDNRAARLRELADGADADGHPLGAEKLRREADDEQARADGAKTVIDTISRAIGGGEA